MTPRWNASPATAATAQVLELYHQGRVSRRASHKPYAVFSYREDFDYLWEIWEEDDASLTSWVFSASDPPTAVVVWDGIPSSGSDINAADYVTPYDWALAWTCAILARAKRRTSTRTREAIAGDLPHLRILILDLCSRQYSGAFACQQFGLIAPALPWIQVYRPVQVGDTQDELKYDVLSNLLSAGLEMSLLRSSFRPGFFGSETLFFDTLSLERILSFRDAHDMRRQSALLNAVSDFDSTLESIVGLWRSNLVRPGSRHQFANLLAPMILAKGLPEELRRKTEREIRRGIGYKARLML